MELAQVESRIQKHNFVVAKIIGYNTKFKVNLLTRQSKSTPIIDISDLFSGKPKTQKHSTFDIYDTVRSHGYLYLDNHGVDQSLFSAVQNCASQFFNQPIDEKLKFYVGNQSVHRGYVPITEKGNYSDETTRNYEAFDMGLDLPANDEDYLSGNPLLGPNVWPAIPRFKETMNQYYDQMFLVSRALCGAFEFALGLKDGALTQEMRKPISQLRLIHYFENKHFAQSEGVNMGAHTDYECFTLLHSNQPGLEVLNPKKRWVAVPPIHGKLTFFIGDMMENWSNGIFLSTPHRVTNNGIERYSVPFFAATNFDTVVKPMVINRERTKFSTKYKYKPIESGKHLLTNMLRDFPYLAKRHINGEFSHYGIRSTKNPFENRINE